MFGIILNVCGFDVDDAKTVEKDVADDDICDVVFEDTSVDCFGGTVFVGGSGGFAEGYDALCPYDSEADDLNVFCSSFRSSNDSVHLSSRDVFMNKPHTITMRRKSTMQR